MFSLRFALVVISLVLFSGCTTIKIEPINTKHCLKHVCIKNCERECFDGGMLSVIQNGFERHGISTQVYRENFPSDCVYHLTYYCERAWDLAMYMHHAELRLYSADDQIGYAEYHLKGEGGLALTKFETTKNKMDPVIDQLLSNYPLAIFAQ